MPMYVAARECTRKRSYQRRSEAKRVQRLMESQTGDLFKRYKCRFCGEYHIAHRVPAGMHEDTDETTEQ